VLLNESLHALQRTGIHHVAGHGVGRIVVGGLHAYFQLPVKQLLAQRQGFWSTCDP
jgi:hypothetical protein